MNSRPKKIKARKELPAESLLSGPIKKIILIRHGQYDMTGKVPDRGSLTKLGKYQARLSAQRIRIEEKHITLFASTKPRALETAREFEKVFRQKAKRSSLIWECLPRFHPRDRKMFSDLKLKASKIAKEARYAEAAFRKFVAAPATRNETCVVVSHGNLIRYLVARCMGTDGTAWTRMGILQASVSVVTVDAKGVLALLRFNDVGHIPRPKRTFL